MNYYTPKSLDDALNKAVEKKENSAFIAGGTDLWVQKHQGNQDAGTLIDLLNLPELNSIQPGKEEWSLGATVTLDHIATGSKLREVFPILSQTARQIATPVIRKTATIAGNILCENRCLYFNQSAFWRDAAGHCLKCDGPSCHVTGTSKNCYSVYISDMAPALIVLGAKIEYMDENGRHTLPLENIFSGDGLQPVNLPGESIITRFLIPVAKHRSTYFRKLRPRKSVDFTNLSLALSRPDNNGYIKLSLAGLAPKPLSFSFSSPEELPEIKTGIRKQSQIINNLPFTRLYRKEMMGVLLEEALKNTGAIRNNL